jgi:hypothetical protein
LVSEALNERVIVAEDDGVLLAAILTVSPLCGFKPHGGHREIGAVSLSDVASAPLAPIKGSKWVPEPFVCDRGPSEGATTDASPVQNLVRTHLEAVELPEPVVLLPEHNR